MQTAYITLANATPGRDPERKQSRTGTSFASFSVAVNQRQGSEEFPNWFTITAFGKLGETVLDLAEKGHLVKGRSVVIVGRFAARPYTDKSGVERSNLDVTASDVILVGGRNDTGDVDTSEVPF